MSTMTWWDQWAQMAKWDKGLDNANALCYGYDRG